MEKSLVTRSLSLALSVLIVLTSSAATVTQAAMVTSQQALQTEQQLNNRAEVLRILQQDDVKQALIERGVDPLQVQQRVAALTDSEVEQLHAQLDELPAGAGAIGIIVTIFIVLIITDMLCATNVFTFVNCINR